MTGYLTTHVLDTARGCPAAGLEITLHRIEGDTHVPVGSAVTNDDGRTEAPILPEAAFAPGVYELVFACGTYLRATGQVQADPAFLDEVPIRFGMAERAHYHVPLLLSPFAYSTYRGS